MKIIVTRDTKVDGKYLPAGKKPVDLDDDNARLLIRLKKAIPAVQPKAEPSQGTKGKPTNAVNPPLPGTESPAGEEGANA